MTPFPPSQTIAQQLPPLCISRILLISLVIKTPTELTNASAALKSLFSPVQTPTVSVSVKISKQKHSGFFFMYKRGDVKKNVIIFLSKLRIQQQTLGPKCPNFLGRQVGQTEEYLSKFIFVHTRLQGRQGTPNLDICPNFRRFFFGSPS